MLGRFVLSGGTTVTRIVLPATGAEAAVVVGSVGKEVANGAVDAGMHSAVVAESQRTFKGITVYVLPTHGVPSPLD
jgi:hypothetical protein